MNHEATFRLLLIAAIAVMAPIGGYYRLRSQATGEFLDRRQEGWFVLLTLRPLAGLRLAGVVAWLIDPRYMDWSALPLPLWLRWTGAILGVLTVGLLIWTFRSLGPNLTDTVVTREKHTLVTHGPYRFVRHPFYLALLLAVTADSLMIANGFLALLGAIIFGLIAWRTRKEEALLIERFGDDYRRFIESRNRFLPFI